LCTQNSKPVKNLTNLLLAVMATLSVAAQPKLFDNPPSGFSKSMEIILGDFPYNYKHITGDLVQTEGEIEQFASTITLPGAESCTIGFYHSALDTTASWQALMFRNEAFEKAAKEYKHLYHQLNRCKLRMVDGSVYELSGDMETPAEENDMLVSELKIQTADERYRNFKVELEMLYRLDQWVININVVSRKKDSEEHPDWME
jgi:hypothetical protein